VKLSGQMEKSILELIKMIKNMVLVYSYGKPINVMKENGLMADNMGKVK
jgi:hypothetical protein